VHAALSPASPRRGYLWLAVVVGAWGLTWPVSKLILSSVPPLWAVVFRSAIGTAAMVVIGLLAGRLARPARGDAPVLVGIALLHMVGFGLLASVGLLLVPTGRSVVLAYTTPLWVGPGAALFLGERLTARRALGVAVGLLGLVALFNPLALDWSARGVVLGHLAILAAALLWAASILQIRGHVWRTTALDVIPWSLALATLVTGVVALAVEGAPHVRWSVRLVLLLLYAGVPGTALAYWATAMASRTLPAVTTSLGLLATPVVSVVIATLWLGEPVTLPLVVAITLILGGVALGITPPWASGPRGRRAP
jgi:drug/metabolite transporter (DMT)-like permease